METNPTNEPIAETPAEEVPVIEAPVEEPKPEEVPETPVEEEARAVASPLEEAIGLLAKATPEELDALGDEAKATLAGFLSANVPTVLASRLDWTKNALTSLHGILKKVLEENEEFRVTSKTTLQKNVAILEEQVKGTSLNKLLKTVAGFYSTYCFMIDAPIDENKTRSNIEGIFEELEGFLCDYDCELVRAKVGDDFDPIVAKIAKRIPTSDASLDKKIAAVRSPGWKKGRIVLVPMRADMYEYHPEAPTSEHQ